MGAAPSIPEATVEPRRACQQAVLKKLLKWDCNLDGSSPECVDDGPNPDEALWFRLTVRERLRTDIVTLLRTRAIVVLGSKGEGKSSAVNSAWSAMAEELETPAPAGDGADSFTNDAHCYSIDVPADLGLVDSWEDKNQEEYQSRKKCLISWLLSKDAGCVVLKLAAPTLQTTIEANGTIAHQSRAGISLKVVKDLHKAVCDSGMNVLCVLSKADVVDKAVAQDIRNIVFSKSIHLLRKCINSQTGIPMNQILPCVNFVDDCPGDNPVMSHLHLHILYTMLKMSRHKKYAEQPPLYNQAVAPVEPAEDLHIPPAALVEPTEDLLIPPVALVEPAEDLHISPVALVEPAEDLHIPPVALVEPVEDLHIPPVAPVEPAEDTVCSSTSTAAPSIQSDRSNSSDAGDGINVEENVADEDDEASGAPAGAFQVVSDADDWVSGSIASGSSVGSNNGDTSPRSVESAPQ